MSNSKLPLWPFLVADALLLAAAAAIFSRAHRPWMWWEPALMAGCVAAAAGALILPFLRNAVRDQAASQAQLLSQTALEMRKAEQLAAEIAGAARQWSQYQEQTTHSAAAAAAVAESIASGSAALAESLRKGADAEKNHLRLEIDKLKRGESEWLHVVVHMLDHVYALYQAARHSEHQSVAEQIGHFQNSCREAARRVGLAPALATPGEAFDPKFHQLPKDAAPPENPVIAETLATGYTYQGQLLRRALVALQKS